MPQMSPLSWLILFIIFSLSFIIFNMMNFFNYSLNNYFNFNKKIKLNKNFISLKWKW